jgi:hypothetical protein
VTRLMTGWIVGHWRRHGAQDAITERDCGTQAGFRRRGLTYMALRLASWLAGPSEERNTGPNLEISNMHGKVLLE